MPADKETYLADEAVGGVFGFFRDFGTRETIESIIIAIVLALMFRAYEAEAFIIPTGSMAPSLQGEHKDLECENCKFRYRAGASYENFTGDNRDTIESTFCPICQYKTKMRATVPDHNSNNGDRILVNKFIYDFSDPQRYDVIVFKNPGNGKQNYIKRLIGLPGDNILIENGDIYLLERNADGGWDREISRKPSHKLRHVLQEVDDTDHIGKYLNDVDWPSRWQEFDGGSNWEVVSNNGNPNFISIPTAQPSWLRYRHYRPYKSEWPTILSGRRPERFKNLNELPPGRLIGDHYAYNDGLYSRERPDYKDLGLHWVGDIGIKCWADVISKDGILMFDLVEGGAHFILHIDVATGEASIRCDDDSVTFKNDAGEIVETPIGSTKLRGPGEYRIEYVNADDKIHLWVNNQLIDFDAPEYEREGYVIPQYSPEDPADAEPAGIAAQNLEVRIKRLRLMRDIYYTSVWGTPQQTRVSNLENETGANFEQIEQIFRRPDLWSQPAVIDFFKMKKQQTDPMFELRKGETREKDQFLPMGDNSPQSMDGRVWDGPKYVERDMLIGRALFVYWPHTLNEPIRYFPNFGRMGFIR